MEGVAESQQAAELLHATVALARSLDMPVTAEGVETAAQADALRLAGCELLQAICSANRQVKMQLPRP